MEGFQTTIADTPLMTVAIIPIEILAIKVTATVGEDTMLLTVLQNKTMSLIPLGITTVMASQDGIDLKKTTEAKDRVVQKEDRGGDMKISDGEVT